MLLKQVREKSTHSESQGKIFLYASITENTLCSLFTLPGCILHAHLFIEIIANQTKSMDVFFGKKKVHLFSQWQAFS